MPIKIITPNNKSLGRHFFFEATRDQTAESEFLASLNKRNETRNYSSDLKSLEKTKTDSSEYDDDLRKEEREAFVNEVTEIGRGNNQTKKADTSQLSQANQSSQSVLGLIGGGNSGSGKAESSTASSESAATAPKKMQQAPMSRLAQANQTAQSALGLIGGSSASAPVATTEEEDPEAIEPQPVQKGGSLDIAG